MGTAPNAFQASYAFTRSQEGGVVDNKNDPGGLTCCGITMADLRQFSRGAVQHDLLALTDAEITAIYLALYWLPIAGWSLPPMIALQVFDHAVNCGVGDSAKLLQRLVGVARDGQVGRDTLAALRAVPPGNLPALAQSLSEAQLADYRRKADARFFIKGWEARLDARLVAARALYFTGAVA